MATPGEQQPPPRIQIESPAPSIDCGRYPAKACVGDTVHVAADIFRDGHDVLRAVVRYRPPGEGAAWREAPLRHVDAHHQGVHWVGEFPVDARGRWTWTITAWTDHLAS